jgi:hypothetical protein
LSAAAPVRLFQRQFYDAHRDGKFMHISRLRAEGFPNFNRAEQRPPSPPVPG